MARIPRDVRQADVVAAFCRLGGSERQGKGSHRLVKMPSGIVLSIPAGTLKVGLLRSQIRRAEVSDDEFLAALKR